MNSVHDWIHARVMRSTSTAGRHKHVPQTAVCTVYCTCCTVPCEAHYHYRPTPPPGAHPLPPLPPLYLPTSIVRDHRRSLILGRGRPCVHATEGALLASILQDNYGLWPCQSLEGFELHTGGGACHDGGAGGLALALAAAAYLDGAYSLHLGHAMP